MDYLNAFLCGGVLCAIGQLLIDRTQLTPARILTGLKQGRWRRILFAPTGALLSPTSSFQGESIPGICHLVCVSTER